MRWYDLIEGDTVACGCVFPHLFEAAAETADDGAEMSPADYKLEAKYEAFNQQLFDGALPKIPMRFRKLKRVGGFVAAKTVGGKNGITQRLLPGSVRMLINSAYLRSEQALDGILLHEMIHVWEFTVANEFTNSHGRIFRTKADEISQRVGFKIPLTDDVEGLDLATTKIKPIGVIVFGQDDGRYTYAIVSATTLAAKLDEVKQRYAGYVPRRNTSIRMYSIATPLWAKKAMTVPAQRNVTGSLNQRYFTDPDLLAELAEQGTLLGEVEPQSLQTR